MPRKKELVAEDIHNCTNCAFRLHDDDTDYCRRFPPVAVTDEDGFGFTYIPVEPLAWCGEWKRALQS